MNHEMQVDNPSATIKFYASTMSLLCGCQSVNNYSLWLQDQLATTSTNYEKQLSTMSDHLCELNEKLLKQNEEIEDLKRPSKVVISLSFKHWIAELLCKTLILYTQGKRKGK